MAGERNSWINDHEVDFSVPFLADNDAAMPAASSSHPRTPPSTFRRSFPSSPLNPSTPSMPSSLRTPSTPNSPPRIPHIPSEESRAFSTTGPLGLSPATSHGSMILYRIADPITLPSLSTSNDVPHGPHGPRTVRASMYSTTSGDSTSKYPTSSMSFGGERGLIAYPYDPEEDEKEPPDEEDKMHDPSQRYHHDIRKEKGDLGVSPRGLINGAMLVAMITSILCLFVLYPVIATVRDNGRNFLITSNARINATGQASANFTPGDIGSSSDFIDQSTPQSAFSFVGINGVTYDLAFSNEFNFTNETFRHNDNIFWEARNKDLSSPDQVTTQSGQLVFFINPLASPSGEYLSGILDSVVPFCIGRGFVEVGIQAADGTESRIFWAGGAWSFTSAPPDNPVPAGSSLNMDVSLSLSIGVLASKIPRNTPAEQVPVSASIDYVRYYDRRVDPGFPQGACDVQRSVSKTATLDLLNTPALKLDPSMCHSYYSRWAFDTSVRYPTYPHPLFASPFIVNWVTRGL
ncbi:glycoside hydrolase family 16 protein [Macrolepiota fuliginosa MF-IS2]|uniref:Glycoside hydrolase family 16 protein n=1 Tax=Macrolepiota fuliginosa MF-IS2 TaxID=1400762 RepID=A0A9P6BY39_9AGAR|nr:glycoside hydrolase family 16 protein [Macrolepiota fuliginosa MF-IS2]